MAATTTTPVTPKTSTATSTAMTKALGLNQL